MTLIYVDFTKETHIEHFNATIFGGSASSYINKGITEMVYDKASGYIQAQVMNGKYVRLNTFGYNKTEISKIKHITD